MNREKLSEVKVVQSVKPGAYTTTQTGAAVDLVDADSALLVADVGLSGITLSGTNKITVTMEHSDASESGFVAVPKELLLLEGGMATVDGQVVELDAPAKASVVYKAAYLGAKRYVRAVATIAGTHGTATGYGINVVKGHLLAAPLA